MRQIGTVPDAHAARTFADYLTTLKVEARLDHQAQGWALWVFDEDRVQQAKAELEQFLRNPDDPRFARKATPSTPRPAVAEEDAEDEPDQPPVDLAGLRRVITLVVLLACVAVFVGSNFGTDTAGPLVQALQIAPDGDPTLSHVRRGELWRLVSPIFLHFGLLHLLFDLLLLFDMGRQVEQRRGLVRYLLLMLAVAIVSNVAQFYLGDSGWGVGTGFTFAPNGQFGGISGVVYGLFGYIWVKSRWQPELGFVLTPGTIVLMVGWLFLCLLAPDVVGKGVANVSHGAGLFMGLLIGYSTYVLRAVRQR